MTLSDFANIATVVSGCAVLASLVYLAQQMRQNTKHTSALIQQGRSQQSVDLNLLSVKDSRIGDLFRRGDACDPTLTPELAMSYLSLVLAQLQYAEENYNQYRQNLLSADQQSAMQAWLRSSRASQPGFRAAWSMCRHMASPGFAAFLDGLVEEASAAAPFDVGTTWLRHAAKEREKIEAARLTQQSRREE